MDTVSILLGAGGAVVAFAFAIIVWRANARSRGNRGLAALLIVEGLFQATLAGTSVYGETAVGALYIPWTALTTIAVAYLLFCTTLDGPMARRLAARPMRAAIVLVCLASLVWAIGSGVRLARGGATLDEIEDGFGWPWIVFGLASVLALVISVDAFRASPRESTARRRARAYSIAFGVRDALYAGAILWWPIAEFVLRSESASEVSPLLSGIAPFAFIGLLAYGILSTQLFDIDLRIKWGISRSTVITIGIVAVLGALKTAEYTFNRTFGAVAAGLTAGVVLVLAPRLNKLGDRIANAAMPSVQPTSDYLAFKKLEVYKAAVESALETGNVIDPNERVMLDRLRAKLGLSAADATAVEAEVQPIAVST